MPDDAVTKVIGSSDCGNSPKNKFVQDIAIALETSAKANCVAFVKSYG